MFNPKMINKKGKLYSEELHRDDVVAFLHKLVYGKDSDSIPKKNTSDVRFLVVSNLHPGDMGIVYEYMHDYLASNPGYYIVDYNDFSSYVPEYSALNRLLDLSDLMKVSMDDTSCVYEIVITFDSDDKLEKMIARKLVVPRNIQPKIAIVEKGFSRVKLKIK